jgi:hypothetical protein
LKNYKKQKKEIGMMGYWNDGPSALLRDQIMGGLAKVLVCAGGEN